MCAVGFHFGSILSHSSAVWSPALKLSPESSKESDGSVGLISGLLIRSMYFIPLKLDAYVEKVFFLSNRCFLLEENLFVKRNEHNLQVEPWYILSSLTYKP